MVVIRVIFEQEAAMHEPTYDMVLKRQIKMRQEAEERRKLARLRATNPSLRQRLLYGIGGMLIALGTRLRERFPKPRPTSSPTTSCGAPEVCR